MSRFTTNFLFLGLFLLPTFAQAGGKTVVTDPPTFYRAAQEACDGKGIGAACTINFAGGTVSFGVCIQVPGPAGGYVTCNITPDQIPSCKKASLTGSPTTAAMLLALAGGLLLWSRKRALV